MAPPRNAPAEDERARFGAGAPSAASDTQRTAPGQLGEHRGGTKGGLRGGHRDGAGTSGGHRWGCTRLGAALAGLSVRVCRPPVAPRWGPVGFDPPLCRPRELGSPGVNKPWKLNTPQAKNNAATAAVPAAPLVPVPKISTLGLWAAKKKKKK